MSRIARITLGLLAATLIVGLVATGLVLLGVGPSLRATRLRLFEIFVAAGAVSVLTAGCLLLRFMRWQYALRRAGLRVPAVPGLGAYVASFAFLPIPAYVGQLVARHRLLPPDQRRDPAAVVAAFVWERSFDVWALALIGCAGGPGWLGLALLAGTAGLLVPALRRIGLHSALGAASRIARITTGRPIPFQAQHLAEIVSARSIGLGAVSAVASWLPVAAGIGILGWAAGAQVAWLDWTGAAARSVLLGAVSGVPFGAGVSGFVLLGGFDSLGVETATAAVVVFAFRMATTWFAFALGGVALAVTRRRLARLPLRDHFDRIDRSYDAWLPDHYRELMVRKKTGPMIEAIARLGPDPKGLDVGCGRGWYLHAMTRAGCRMVGIDLSTRQLSAAHDYTGSKALARSSADRLPFTTACFDFAYVINVLHHVPGRPQQQMALREMGRVVRPGGLVFLHEMNPRNPLFRWYMSYLFPILKGIDEGTESFLDPRRLPEAPGLVLREVRYATFTPDFAPAALLAPLTALERRLERGPLAPLGVHFLAVLERSGPLAPDEVQSEASG